MTVLEQLPKYLTQENQIACGDDSAVYKFGKVVVKKYTPLMNELCGDFAEEKRLTEEVAIEKIHQALGKYSADTEIAAASLASSPIKAWAVWHEGIRYKPKVEIVKQGSEAFDLKGRPCISGQKFIAAERLSTVYRDEGIFKPILNKVRKRLTEILPNREFVLTDINMKVAFDKTKLIATIFITDLATTISKTYGDLFH